MEERKRFSIDGCYMPEFLRGFGTLISLTQDSGCAMPDETLYAIDCVLKYFADDLEQFVESAWKGNCELLQLKKETGKISKRR